jgi:hypothetical protein
LAAPQIKFTLPAGAQSLGVAAKAGLDPADDNAKPTAIANATQVMNPRGSAIFILGIIPSVSRRSGQPGATAPRTRAVQYRAAAGSPTWFLPSVRAVKQAMR